MNAWTEMPAGAQPIDAALRAHILAPFVTGIEVALQEVARTIAVERAAYQCDTRHLVGDWGVVIELMSATEGVLALGFQQEAAAALARRMLAEAAVEPDESLVRDCAGELANVVAGQAKAFLAGTADHFTFSPPRFAPAGLEVAPASMRTCLVVIFATEVGSLALQVFLK